MTTAAIAARSTKPADSVRALSTGTQLQPDRGMYVQERARWLREWSVAKRPRSTRRGVAGLEDGGGGMDDKIWHRSRYMQEGERGVQVAKRDGKGREQERWRGTMESCLRWSRVFVSGLAKPESARERDRRGMHVYRYTDESVIRGAGS